MPQNGKKQLRRRRPHNKDAARGAAIIGHGIIFRAAREAWEKKDDEGGCKTPVLGACDESDKDDKDDEDDEAAAEELGLLY